MKKLFTLLFITIVIFTGKVFAGGCSETLFNTPGEIVYFQFRNGSGVDSGQYAMDATMNGASSAADMCGNAAQAVSFSGTSSGASVPHAGYMVIGNTVSISAWIYSTNINAPQRILDKTPVGQSNNYMLDIYQSKLRFFVAGTAVNSTTVLSSNTWYHVAAVYNGSTAKIYLNGAEIASVAGTGLCTSNTMALLIGKDGNNGSCFTGRIDELRLYNAAFSAQEVYQLYHMPTLVENLEDVSVCPGTPSVQLSANFCAANGVTLVYRWYKDGNLINNNSTYSGATTNTLTINNPTQTEVGNYKVSASSSANCITVYSAEAAVSQGTPLTISNNGLVFYYNFSNASMNDLSENGNILTSDGSYSAATGFDGISNEALQIGNVYGPHVGTVPMMDVTNQLTLSLWFNMSSSATSQRLIDKTPSGNGNNFLLDLQNSRLRFICAGTSLQSTTTLSQNTWYHVTATYDGATMKIYINGYLDASASNSTSCVANNLSLVIARDQSGTLGSNAFQGVLDEVRMYSRALSEAEVGLLKILPSITVQPSPTIQTLCTGNDLTLSLTSPTVNAGYQWQLDNTDLSGETSSTLNLTGVATGDAGTYTCIVRLGCASWSSTEADVTVYQSPATPTITQNGASLEATTGGTNYVWYYEGNPIGGANSSTYTPTSNGNYMVVFEDGNGCGAISAPFLFTTVGIENSIAIRFSVYPNPTNNLITIETVETGNFVLTNIVGEILYAKQIKNKAVIEMGNLAAGIYFLTEVNSGKTVKVVKE